MSNRTSSWITCAVTCVSPPVPCGEPRRHLVRRPHLRPRGGRHLGGVSLASASCFAAACPTGRPSAWWRSTAPKAAEAVEKWPISYLDFSTGGGAAVRSTGLAPRPTSAASSCAARGRELVPGEMVLRQLLRPPGHPAGGRAPRGFLPAEDALPEATAWPCSANDLWQRRFGGSRGSSVTSVEINEIPYTVAG